MHATILELGIELWYQLLENKWQCMFLYVANPLTKELDVLTVTRALGYGKVHDWLEYLLHARGFTKLNKIEVVVPDTTHLHVKDKRLRVTIKTKQLFEIAPESVRMH